MTQQQESPKLSKRTANLLDEAVRFQELDPNEDLTFIARFMALTTMPHSDPGDVLHHEVRNGDTTLSITAVPGYGLPYGSIPRLLITWMIREARRRETPVLQLGNNYGKFMESMGLQPKGGKDRYYHKVRDQVRRLHSCKMLVKTDNKRVDGLETVGLLRQSNFFGEVGQGKMHEPAELVLDGDFYNEIIEHVIPVNLIAMRALSGSPLSLDLYMWLPYRLFKLKRQTIIPWDSLKGQFGTGIKSTPKFTQNFKERLNDVAMFYPELRQCVEFVDRQGLLLRKPSSPHIRATVYKKYLPQRQQQGDLFT